MCDQPVTSELYSRIEKARLRSESTKYFVPPDSTRAILTLPNIKNCVAENIPDANDRIYLAEHIEKYGVMVFAILLWMRRVPSIIKFRSHDCLDSRLPIDEAWAVEIEPSFGKTFALEAQWEFLPLHFKKEMSDFHTILQPSRILPIVQRYAITEGAFGEVSRIQIVTSLQKFTESTVCELVTPENNLLISMAQDDTVTVVRKRVKRRKETPNIQHEKMFHKELRTLRLLHQLKHNNIVPLLGSYTYNNEHQFLFPYFEMDLKHFLCLEKRVGDFCWDFTFFFALHGLASALQMTHDLHLTAEEEGVDFESIGYHYDVRPANILVDRSRFILSDFGMGALKSVPEESETSWKNTRGDYIAPECTDAHLHRQRVGRGVDVWAFGCLLADVVAYMTQGPKGVTQFRKSRISSFSTAIAVDSTYFYDSSGQLKGSVGRWLNDLQSTSPSSTASLIRIALQTLEPDAKKRPRMQDVHRQLSMQCLSSLYHTLVEKTLPLSDMTAQGHHDPQTPKIWLWFDIQCIKAYGTVLSTVSPAQSSMIDDREKYKRCTAIFRDLLDAFDSRLTDCGRDAPPTGWAENEVFDLRGSTEERIHSLVQELWKLPARQISHRAQMIWLESLPIDDLDRVSCLETGSRPGEVQELADASAIAQMQSLRRRMVNDPSTTTVRYQRPLDQLVPLKIGGHEYHTFNGQNIVLVEWMYFGPQSKQIQEQQRLAIMELRCQNFATEPKPTGLRILKCSGFVEKASETDIRVGYGFMYELPWSGTTKEMLPLSLNDLLSRGLQDIKNYPPLAARFRLAYALASFFESFYSVGCLHERFNSANVLFSNGPSSPLQSPDAWSDLYVVGLQRSRPDECKWDTEGPPSKIALQLQLGLYQHPHYSRRGRFRLEYDYYSLGVVLLEVGLWRPLQQWSERSEYNKMSLEDFRMRMIKKYVPRLTAHAGELYMGAVLACLDGTLGGGQDTPTMTESKQTFNLFFDRVLVPLEKLALLEI